MPPHRAIQRLKNPVMSLFRSWRMRICALQHHRPCRSLAFPTLALLGFTMGKLRESQNRFDLESELLLSTQRMIDQMHFHG